MYAHCLQTQFCVFRSHATTQTPRTLDVTSESLNFQSHCNILIGSYFPYYFFLKLYEAIRPHSQALWLDTQSKGIQHTAALVLWPTKPTQ